jgi:hypothetical protein
MKADRRFESLPLQQRVTANRVSNERSGLPDMHKRQWKLQGCLSQTVICFIDQRKEAVAALDQRHFELIMLLRIKASSRRSSLRWRTTSDRD